MRKKSTQNIYLSETEKSDLFSQNKVLNKDNLVESNLATYTIKVKKQRQKVSPFVMSMKGAFETRINFDYKEELVNILSDKYL